MVVCHRGIAEQGSALAHAVLQALVHQSVHCILCVNSPRDGTLPGCIPLVPSAGNETQD